MKQKSNYRWLEPLLVILLWVNGIIWKLHYLSIHPGRIGCENELLSHALVTSLDGKILPVQSIAYPCRFIYAKVLRVFFTFFGNNFRTPVYFQLIMQSIALLLLFFAIRKMVGKVAGILVLASLSYIPYVTQTSTEHFFLFLLSAYLLLTAMLWGVLRKEKRKTWIKVVLTILLGLLISTFSYFDFLGVCFLLLPFLGILFIKTEKKWLFSLLYLFSVLLGGGMLLVGMDMLMGKGITEIWNSYYELYFSTFGSNMNYMPVYLVMGFVGIVLIIGGFVRMAINKQLVPLAETDVETVAKAMEEAEEFAEAKETEKKITFIENPLPLPKKHVKREMGYAFEPSKDLMDFDIKELDENDDFDIQ